MQPFGQVNIVEIGRRGAKKAIDHVGPFYMRIL
jgi:hypothetical protein